MVTISIIDSEYRELRDAAKGEGITISAFVADKSLAAARRVDNSPNAAVLREALNDLVNATTQLQKADTNFNQCVAALNSTGQQPGNLPQYARYTAAVIQRVDQAARLVLERIP
jgi:hypothetical protein